MNRSNISNDDSGSNYRYHQKQNNDDDDEDDSDNNTGIQTDDLLDLFSTTMHSLAADAAAIRQITDLAELTGIILSDNNGNKKYGNNNNANEEEENDKREYVQELCNLDRLISGVEQKVIALRQIINEENSALTKFETNLRDEADEQATLIEDLMSALDLQQQQQQQQHDNNMSSSSNDRDDDNRWHARHQKSNDNEDEDEWRYGRYENNDQRQHQYHDKKHIQLSEASSNSNNNKIKNNNTNRKGVLQSRTMGKMGNQSSPHPSRGVNGSRISHNNNNSNRNRNDLYKFSSSSPEKMNNGSCYGDDKDEEQEEEEEENPCFVKVTKSEILEQTPSFGVHLSRFDLNEALEEIERMVWNKISLEPKSSIHSSGSSPPSHLSSNTLQRRFDYLRHRQRGPNAGSDNETEAHVGHRWVSEQELRENCAFFRSGESTARATLQLLCSLKRLKQVPGKNREVTYLCLFS